MSSRFVIYCLNHPAESPTSIMITAKATKTQMKKNSAIHWA